ncbi:hypothetical protein LTR62_007248 [Meristemomyces frigidus]|uniref:molybdopterin adenylyltransferase n=1 Tax=Meristemomyces frigidus TaxID=1508187 RepID=A0AAN7TAQ5_9PEZI|nr:hypothetical protein LTR62_007248 [Meristemomyces frigidus]
MITTFDEARKIIHALASERAIVFAHDEEIIPLDRAVGRTIRSNIHSPLSTPTFDSATVDGYAVIASQTSHASPGTPVRLRCMGVFRPGDRPIDVDDRIIANYVTCVELHTGAPFPIVKSTQRPYDAIVLRDHATILEEGGTGRLIEIVRPPLTSWHKRIAGSDFRQNEIILPRGTSVVPKHIMALASVGIRQISVNKLVQIAIVAVGSELTTTPIHNQALKYQIPDADGPYLTAALREMGEQATYWGVLPSHPGVVSAFLRDKLRNENVDIIITTGDVSRGANSCLAAALAQVGAEIHVQGIAMQPGETAILASLTDATFNALQPSHSPAEPSYAPDLTSIQPSPVAKPGNIGRRPPIIFAIPGSPVAAACCFRFLITPYIRILVGMQPEQEILARVALMRSNLNTSITPSTARHLNLPRSLTLTNNNFNTPTNNPPTATAAAFLTPEAAEMVVQGSQHYDLFRHAVLRSQHDGVFVEVGWERSVAKASPFTDSNCWLHVRREQDGVRAGETGKVYPFCPLKS